MKTYDDLYKADENEKAFLNEFIKMYPHNKNNEEVQINALELLEYLAENNQGSTNFNNNLPRLRGENIRFVQLLEKYAL